AWSPALCAAAVGACEGASQWRWAAHLLDRMGAAAVELTAHCCSAAISSCGRSSLWRCAALLLARFRAQAGRPDAACFSAAIGAAERCARWPAAVWLHRETRRLSLRPDGVNCSSTLSALAKASRWERAALLLRELRREGAGLTAAGCGAAVGHVEGIAANFRGLCSPILILLAAPTVSLTAEDRLFLLLALLATIQFLEMAKKTTKISGPPARKTKVVGIIQQGGGDRATAAYNELTHKDQTGLDQVLDQTSEDKQSRAIQKLSTKNEISWTNEHQRRTSAATAVTDGATNTTKGKGKGNATVEPQPIALDEQDWSATIAQVPKKLPDGTYESSISLHSTEDAEKWCTALRRQKEPLAILAFGTGSKNWAHAQIQIPVPQAPHGTSNPRKTFLNGVIYQFGETDVTMKTNVTQLGEADGNATFMRTTIHEACTQLVNPTMSEVFSSQHSGAAPVAVGGQRTDKLGSTANERWETARKYDAKTTMGNGLPDAIKATMQAICPEIPSHDEPSRLLRAGRANVAPNNTTQLNQDQLQRSLAAILKKMNLQEEHADAPSNKTPRTSDDGKGSKDDDKL
ncbi:unnamed protein product, partial [Prorocentrum cordatum]